MAMTFDATLKDVGRESPEGYLAAFDRPATVPVRRRDVAVRIFRGVRLMQESDTYLMILDEGQEKALRDIILGQGEDRFGPPDESVRASLNHITDLNQLKRMARQTPKAAG